MGSFLTIVDDYSRVVWVFLLKHKNDVTWYLIDFHKWVKTQFENCIKRLRCDNGGEFTSNCMLEFYVDQGITLETTCPHPPPPPKWGTRAKTWKPTRNNMWFKV